MSVLASDPLTRCIIVTGLPNNVTPLKIKLFNQHFNRKVSEVLGHNRFDVYLTTDPQTQCVSGAFLTFATSADA